MSIAVIIDYTNYRGERSERRILPDRLWFGTSPHHEGTQWFLRAFDPAKVADRDFAMKDVHEWRRA